MNYIIKSSNWQVCLIAVAILLLPTLLNAQSTEERLERLEREIESLRESQNSGNNSGESSGLTWGAYGEIKYVDHLSNYKTNQFDVHRLVLLTEYEFNDWVDFLGEIEYEHAGFVSETVAGTTVNESEVFVEQAYVNLEFSEAFQFRPGLLLLPIGPTNIRHEPTTFLGVERPRSESNIIPSTWREIGAVVHGKIDRFGYQVGMVNGPRGSNFSSSSWIRGGRTKGSKSRAEGLAGFVALDYEILNGITAGTSYYQGQSGQGDIAEINWKNRLNDPVDSWSDDTGLKTAYQEIVANENKKGKVLVHIAEAHLTLNHGPWMGRAMYVQGWMNEDDTREVNKATGKNIGKVVEGAYGEIGYNVLSLMDTDQKLYPYIRLEYVNTQKETVSRHFGGQEDIQDLICQSVLNGTCNTTSQLTNGNQDLGIIAASDSSKELYGVTGVADRTNDQRITTLGFAYFPDPGVVIKGEYERQDSKSDHHTDIESRNSSNNKIDRIQFAVGFYF